MTTTAIVAVGNEVTEGRIANTNASWLSRRLHLQGHDVALHLAVPDEPRRMREAFSEAARRAAIVIVSGGLGPTRDDLTREVAAEAAGVPLDEDAASLAHIERLFAMLGRAMHANNRKQALFPRGATVIPNAHGSAPAFSMDLEGARFFFLPGVPRELEHLMRDHVEPAILRLSGGAAPRPTRRLNCFGLPESEVDARVTALLATRPGLEALFNLAKGPIEIYLIAKGMDAHDAAPRLDELCAAVRADLGVHVFSDGETSLAEVVLVSCRERARTIGLAESCTGGLATQLLSRIAGASDVLRGGVIAYANDAKHKVLGVDAELIHTHGAVSDEVARAMAEGACTTLGASLGVGITGIAGPTGGTPEKPVGTVFVAVAEDGRAVESRRLKLRGEREAIQRLGALSGLDLARRVLRS